MQFKAESSKSARPECLPIEVSFWNAAGGAYRTEMEMTLGVRKPDVVSEAMTLEEAVNMLVVDTDCDLAVVKEEYFGYSINCFVYIDGEPALKETYFALITDMLEEEYFNAIWGVQ